MHPLGANDYSESDPAVLPNGKHALVVVSDKAQRQRIEFRSFTSSATKIVLDDAGLPQYFGGFLFFIRNQEILRNYLTPVPAGFLALRRRSRMPTGIR
jgi:hypothetical protein